MERVLQKNNGFIENLNKYKTINIDINSSSLDTEVGK